MVVQLNFFLCEVCVSPAQHHSRRPQDWTCDTRRHSFHLHDWLHDGCRDTTRGYAFKPCQKFPVRKCLWKRRARGGRRRFFSVNGTELQVWLKRTTASWWQDWRDTLSAPVMEMLDVDGAGSLWPSFICILTLFYKPSRKMRHVSEMKIYKQRALAWTFLSHTLKNAGLFTTRRKVKKCIFSTLFYSPVSHVQTVYLLQKIS